jgi:hypothetical protein
MDEIIFSIEMDMAKKKCNQSFDKRWVVHNLNQHIRKVANPQPFENFYV